MRRTAVIQYFRSGWFWLGIGLAVVLLRGLFLDVMDIDASQYASISMEMLQNGSWLEVQHRGADYLDKPPLLFWLSASSFSLFGLSNWAYKLPSLIGALAGIWGLYHFCRLFYAPKIARQAAFILASSMGLIVICNDVRTDTLLLGTTTCAIWQLAAYQQLNRWKHLLGGFFLCGLAMLAKGPIGLVVPGFAMGTHLLLNRDWRGIFRWQWLVGLAVTALVLAPMCWGLWHQFDLHPEKTVNGRTGVSGLYFFFWEQSFGRVTGENVWHNDTSGFYFLHVYLWAFLPWCLLLPAALWERFRQIFKVEGYTLGAFLLTFIALSMSQYKLPHYIFITLPWAAVLTANYLNPSGNVDKSPGKWSWAGLYTSVFLAFLVLGLLLWWVFATNNLAISAVVILLSGALAYRIFKNPAPVDSDILVQRGVWASIIIGMVLNFHFYPHLLPYQAAKSMAQYARAHAIPPEKMGFFHRGSFSLDFYNGDILDEYNLVDDVVNRAKKDGAIWLQADEAGKTELELSGVKFEVEGRFKQFPVSQLNAKFLNPATREQALSDIYLLKIGG